MTPGFRTLTIAALLGCASLSPAIAQDPQAELVAIRKLVEQQSDQIARLTTEVGRLSALIEGPRRSETAPPAPAPGRAVVAAPPAEPVRPAIAPAGPVHVVVKGDSLDKIAKQYGTTAIDLQKLNKISDPKKLQIGQQINLPANTVVPPAGAAATPAPAPAPSPAPEKKEP